MNDLNSRRRRSNFKTFWQGFVEYFDHYCSKISTLKFRGIWMLLVAYSEGKSCLFSPPQAIPQNFHEIMEKQIRMYMPVCFPLSCMRGGDNNTAMCL